MFDNIKSKKNCLRSGDGDLQGVEVKFLRKQKLLEPYFQKVKPAQILDKIPHIFSHS